MASTSKYINKLADNHVLILGGTSGIGFCVAEASIEHGASVVIAGSRPENLKKALNRLRTSYPSSSSKITGYTCDLINPADLEANLQALLEKATNQKSKKINHVVFTAGDKFHTVPVDERTPDSLSSVMTVRVTASAMLAKLLPAYIVPELSSSFTLTGGVLSQKPGPGTALLAAVGNAVEGLARGLAVEMTPLRVNVVAPGAVHTEFFEMFGNQLPYVLKSCGDAMLTGVVGKPEDVAESYVYLMKDHNVTGFVLESNGGNLLK